MNEPLMTAPALASPAPAHSAAPEPPRAHILVVDDDFYTRELSAGILIHSGYNVETAEDGADAWRALNEARFDLLVTDHQMPKVTGLELIKALRAEDQSLPIILASSAPPTAELDQNPWLRVAATLTKPYTLQDLLGAVKDALSAAPGDRAATVPPPNWPCSPSAGGMPAQ